MATRNLTFKSSDLGDNVTLMLCFTPPSSDLFVNQFPIAWKVTTLAAKGRSSLNATWTSTLGFCAAQIGHGNMVTAGNYIPINVGEVTTLQVDRTISPPVYHFTEPKALAGVKTVQAVNGTGGPAPIGLGFITDLDTDEEEMHTAITYPNVGAGLAVTGEFTPVLSAYIALDYKQTQLLRADIRSVAPIWSENLISLQQDTTIIVKKNAAGGYETHQLNASVADDVFDIDALPLSIDNGIAFRYKRSYQATLSFEDSTPSAVADGLIAISNHLLEKGYEVKVVTKAGDTDQKIELDLPYNISCNQAEKEILGVIEGFGFPTRAAIKARGGELRVYRAGEFNYSVDINPASPEWFSGDKVSANPPIGSGAQPLAIANGTNESANGSANGHADAEPAPSPVPLSYGKTRVPGKKGPSSVSSYGA